MGRFVEKENPHENRPNRTNSRPDRISCSNRQCLGGFDEQYHTDGEADDKSGIPEIRGCTGGFLRFAEAGRKPDLKQPGNDEYNPVHFPKVVKLENLKHETLNI